LTVSRWSQVENCDSPRNWPDPRAQLREGLLGASRASFAIAQEVERELLDARRMPLAERRERPLVAVLCAFDQDGSLSRA
jgi:hypothetical protein